MKRLTDKCLKEIKDVEEGVISEPEYRGKRVRALLRIDASDEKNLSHEQRQSESEYFYMRNKHDIPNLKRVDIKIDTEAEVDESEIHEAIRTRLNHGCCK
ncbi:MAG: hypothetical protein ACTSRU_12530 [Candidatus Hodarchaeales archaeon]